MWHELGAFSSMGQLGLGQNVSASHPADNDNGPDRYRYDRTDTDKTASAMGPIPIKTDTALSAMRPIPIMADIGPIPIIGIGPISSCRSLVMAVCRIEISV